MVTYGGFAMSGKYFVTRFMLDLAKQDSILLI